MKKQLIFDLYNSSNCGMCNQLMSLQLGVIMARLMDRQLVVRGVRPIPPNAKDLTIFDLFDTTGLDVVVDNAATCPVALPHELHNAVIVPFAPIDPDHFTAFTATRCNVINLEHYQDCAAVATLNHNTLGYYSYCIYLRDTDPYQILSESAWRIRPNQMYADAAANVILRTQTLDFVSVHLRRTDFGVFAQNSHIQVADFAPMLVKCVGERPLFVHSDEPNLSYFAELHHQFGRVILIDQLIAHLYPRFDLIELGLVSLLVAAKSQVFFGTMLSTYSGIIQQFRLIHGNPLYDPKFRYLYSQYPDDIILALDGQIACPVAADFKPTWTAYNHLPHCSQMAFWWREWPEYK